MTFPPNNDGALTPDHLLDETFDLARRILNDLKKAAARPSKEYPFLSSVGFRCLPEDTPLFVAKRCKSLDGDVLLRKGYYQASCPEIIDTLCSGLLPYLLTSANFDYAADPMKFSAYREKDFSLDFTRSFNTLSAFRIVARTTAAALQKVITLDDRELKDTLRDALADILEAVKDGVTMASRDRNPAYFTAVPGVQSSAAFAGNIYNHALRNPQFKKQPPLPADKRPVLKLYLGS